MHHNNVVLPWSLVRSIENDVPPGIDVPITHIEEVSATPRNSVAGAMCLVKIYNHRDYMTPICLYQEPKNATKACPRYWRHGASKSPVPI